MLVELALSNLSEHPFPRIGIFGDINIYAHIGSRWSSWSITNW